MDCSTDTRGGGRRDQKKFSSSKEENEKESSDPRVAQEQRGEIERKDATRGECAAESPAELIDHQEEERKAMEESGELRAPALRLK
jgi:hypothetical protein